MKIRLWNWAAALALLATRAFAAAGDPSTPTLAIGSTAPKLQTGDWVQGEAVKEFAPGKAYLVEFWATWCGPCRASIPHLNEVHRKYKDQGLIVIGQNCWERDEKLVAPFIKEMGDKMTYRVALDDKDGAMAATWMAAAGRNGIPSAFLVDTKGVIAWVGHPMELKEEVIEAVLAGKFDVRKAAEEYRAKQQTEAAMSAVWRDLQTAVEAQKWDQAEAKLKEAEKLLPADERDGLNPVWFDLELRKGDYAAAYRLAEKMSDAHPDNAMLQNQIAWQMLTDARIKQRDLKLAEKIAGRANTAAKGADPAILDTLARACFMNDKKDQAITLQQQAVDKATGPMKASLQATLDSYKQGTLPKAE